MLFGGEQLNWIGGIGALLIIGSCYWGLGIEQSARQKRLSAAGVASVSEPRN
jgi:drug/metabolite transporter (DMT)-like permease